MPIKVYMSFAESTYRVLEDLAHQEGKSKAEVLRDALALRKWVLKARRTGGHILLERDGKVREIVPL